MCLRNRCLLPAFDHIPHEERNSNWFILLGPLLVERLLRGDAEKSPLLSAMNRTDGFSSWKGIKVLIEEVLKHVLYGERIFSRASEVETNPNPDDPIADMFAECRAALYLLQKGFHELSYSRQNDIDYRTKFDGKTYHVEVTYLHGPDFKIFGNSNPDQTVMKPGEEWDYSRKLINHLKSKYSKKESQFTRRSLDCSFCLILMITDLMETHEPWFDHAKINGLHPIQYFVKTRNIATVVHGCGTVYEPDPTSLGGVFGKLNRFSWENYPRENT
jgi:hypothetical protein